MEERKCTRTDLNQESPRQEWDIRYRDLNRQQRRQLARQRHGPMPRSINTPIRYKPRSD